MGTFLTKLHRVHLRVALIVFACFLQASTGWLAWLYHLTPLAASFSVDALTMVVGYLMQAAGVGTYIFLGKRWVEDRARRMSMAAIGAFVVCLAFAVLSPNVAIVLAFGYLANVLCGFVQGYYLYCLAHYVDERRRGTVFGGAYAASTACGWILSVIANGMLTHGVVGVVFCALLAVPCMVLIGKGFSDVPDAPAGQDAAAKRAKEPDQQVIVLACGTVLLMSLTKNAGFGFPITDLLAGVNLEFSRLFYGAGLLVAGLVSDKDRRYGALCCAAALVTPFLMLALSGAAAPATIMWALGYLFFGFFTIFRVLVLADLTMCEGIPVVAGTGLLFGRVGDALGTALVVLASAPLMLILVSSVLFAFTMALFFALYQRLYTPAEEVVPTEREIFERFAAEHDLSSREREVLRLVLDEQSNAEIAATLYVSEATVKYHVRNILKKTGCKNRLEVMARYANV